MRKIVSYFLVAVIALSAPCHAKAAENFSGAERAVLPFTDV